MDMVDNCSLLQREQCVFSVEVYICPQPAGIIALSNHDDQNGPLSVFTTLSSKGFRDSEQRCEFEPCDTSLVSSNAFDDV